MDYFGRRSPSRSPRLQLKEEDENKYNKVQHAFLNQATLVENLSFQLDEYEMSLRESKKCLHALTDTMSDLYENMGPQDKEFRIAMEDHERLLEYKAHAMHAVNHGTVNKFREVHDYGKRLVRERDGNKQEHEAAVEALQRLHKMGKGNDRRVPQMEAELNTMSRQLQKATDLAIRDLPLSLFLRGPFIAEIFPTIFRIDREYNEESNKVSEAQYDIIKQLEGMHVGFDADSMKKFTATRRKDVCKYINKYRSFTYEDEVEEEDDDDRRQEIQKESRSPRNIPKRSLTPPSPGRGSVGRSTSTPRRSAPPAPSSEERFFDVPTRLFDSTGRIII